MVWISEKYSDLLQDRKKAFGWLATLMKNGSPQLTMIWFNTDEKHILINSAVGRIKDKNMRRDPHVALVITDPMNMYRFVQIRGKVVEITTEGAREHIDALSKKYTGRDKYTDGNPNDQRVIYKILPLKITEH